MHKIYLVQITFKHKHTSALLCHILENRAVPDLTGIPPVLYRWSVTMQVSVVLSSVAVSMCCLNFEVWVHSLVDFSLEASGLLWCIPIGSTLCLGICLATSYLRSHSTLLKLISSTTTETYDVASSGEKKKKRVGWCLVPRIDFWTR